MRPQLILMATLCSLMSTMPSNEPKPALAIVVTRQINALGELNSSNTRLVRVPASSLLQGVLSADDRIDRLAMPRLLPGTLIMRHNTMERGTWSASPGPSTDLRVVTVGLEVDSVPEPGKRVNLVFRFDDMPGTPPVLVMHNIEIFAVDLVPQGLENVSHNVSVLVTREGGYALLCASRLPDTSCEIELLEP